MQPDNERRFKDRQARIEFYNSKEFKDMEAERVANHRPTEHETVGYGRVYCPIAGRIQPDWLCAMDHGDYHEVLDTEH